jgi:hypothetical protein
LASSFVDAFRIAAWPIGRAPFRGGAAAASLLRADPTTERYPIPVYLTPDQVSTMLPGISRGKLAQLRFNGTGPNYRKPTPKTVLYVESEVVAWVESSARWGVNGGAA